MKCQCGKSDLTFSMVLGPFKRLGGEEVAFVHSGVKCGWAYECMDCWNTDDAMYTGGYVAGFDSEYDASVALWRHIHEHCGPNKAVRIA